MSTERPLCACGAHPTMRDEDLCIVCWSQTPHGSRRLLVIVQRAIASDDAVIALCAERLVDAVIFGKTRTDG